MLVKNMLNMIQTENILYKRLEWFSVPHGLLSNISLHTVSAS